MLLIVKLLRFNAIHLSMSCSNIHNPSTSCSTLFKIPFPYVVYIQCRPQPLYITKY